MKIEGIPDGWEVVRWGKPKRGELFLLDDGKVTDAMFDFERDHVLIVRKIEPVLDVSKIRLKKGWIAQDKAGGNYWFSHRPVVKYGDNWWSHSEHNKIDNMDDCYLSAKGLHIPWREDVPWSERIMEVGE